MTADDFRRQCADGNDWVEAHTSGSTGEPKLIRMLKSDMIISARATCRRLDLGAGSVFATPLSADYIAGKMMIVRQIISGGELVELPRSRHPLRGYDGKAIDLLAIVPAQIPDLLEALDRGVVIRKVIVGGGPISRADEPLLAACSAEVYATYGMTETCSHIALRRAGQELYTTMPEITVSENEHGCLRIDTGRMSVGVTDTRDIAEVVTPTTFRWVGRIDNVIISGGLKLYPEEIERRLDGVMAGREFYITKRASSLWGEEAVMIITDGKGVDDDLRLAVSAALPGPMRPKDIIEDNAPEYTASGKLKRRREV